MAKLELISFKTCPFVQRSVIVLLEKKLEFKITYIDIANKPDWFLAISPTGKVPLLKVDDEVLFESAIINEYLDEILPSHMLPADPLQKAKTRAWIEFSSGLIMSIVKLTSVASENEFIAVRDELTNKLVQIERILMQHPYFHGVNFGLVDAAFAPFFMRVHYLETFKPLNLLQEFPKIHSWSDEINKRESVQNSVVPEFSDLLLKRMKEKNSYFSQLIK